MTEPARVTINGQPASVDAQNRFAGVVPVTPGTSTVTINAVDPSGNASEAVYEMDQAGTSKTFTYDANGNMTSDGTRTFEWDARNQLVAVNVGTHRTEFAYDGLQRRVREIEKENGGPYSDTRMVWCGSGVCEERTEAAAVTGRLLGLGLQVSGEARFLTKDHLGTTREVTGGTGSVHARYKYDPWGRRHVVGNDVMGTALTGHRWHGAGLTLTLHRAYDADLSRWLTEDPIGLRGGWNLYSYVRQNPLAKVDPLGLRIACLSTVSYERAQSSGCGSGADHWGCADPSNIDAPDEIAVTGCSGACGKYHFDAIVTLPIVVTYTRDPDTVLPSLGVTIRQHESEHVQDYLTWCHGLDRRFRSEGFSTATECERARQAFLQGYVRSWNATQQQTREHDRR